MAIGDDIPLTVTQALQRFAHSLKYRVPQQLGRVRTITGTTKRRPARTGPPRGR